VGLVDRAKTLGGQAAGKAKELGEQAAAKVNELGGDELIADAIVRAAEKRERVNAMLASKGCAWRIDSIEVENAIPPKAVFILGPASDGK